VFCAQWNGGTKRKRKNAGRTSVLMDWGVEKEKGNLWPARRREKEKRPTIGGGVGGGKRKIRGERLSQKARKSDCAAWQPTEKQTTTEKGRKTRPELITR